YDPRRLDLEGQAEELLNTHRNVWLAGLQKWIVFHPISNFERGFPVGVQATVDELLDRGDELWSAAPFRHLFLYRRWQYGGGSRFPAVMYYPLFAQLRRLTLLGTPSWAAALPRLLASPHLAGLTELGLYPPPDQPWLQTLLASPLRHQLTGLALGSYHPVA